MGKLPCSSVVLTLSADWDMHNPLLCYPPLSTVGADHARFLYGRRVGRPFTVLPPYTTPRLNAACFGAISVGVLGDLSLCYLPTLHLG